MLELISNQCLYCHIVPIHLVWHTSLYSSINMLESAESTIHIPQVLLLP